MTLQPTLDLRLDSDAMRIALERDAVVGLTSIPKTLPAVWFYDEVGSDLFDQITRLDEYYPTRAERTLLEAHASVIAKATQATTLVELGAGTCTKTRVLLDAMAANGTLRHYIGVDIAHSTLEAATREIVSEYPGLQVTATVADFHDLGGLFSGVGTKLVAFLGGTIGNLEPNERQKLFMNLDVELESNDAFLIGTDLVKDRRRLVAAYDDSLGVTAAFNLNVLTVLNRELGANFDIDAFTHVALFDEDHQWVEMRLRATSPQQVFIAGLGLEIFFAEGEELRTEISAKFTAEGISKELNDGGFVVSHQFDQPGGDFLLTLAHPYC
jgi:L-histidine N-alpha-methyltransferase